jgi:Tol biopolymer transport system component
MDSTLPASLARHDAFLDRLLAVPLVVAARLSPDGRWLAWIWSGVAATRQLWLAPGDGTAPPRCLVGDDWDCDSFNWAPDSRSIVYGRSRDGDERVGLHQLFLDGRPPRALTADRPNYFIRGGQLTADGRTLIYAANVDPRDGRPLESGPIFRHDIAGGTRRIIAHPARAGNDEAMPRLSPDDRHILYSRHDHDPAGSQLWLTDVDGSSDREIVNAGDAAKVVGYWSPDGSAIVVTVDAGDRRRIGLWRLADGVLDWLIDDSRRALVAAAWPSRSPAVVVEESSAGRSRYTLFDPLSRREQPFPETAGT